VWGCGEGQKGRRALKHFLAWKAFLIKIIRPPRYQTVLDDYDETVVEPALYISSP
jgi:hypothetical protein